jgi:hypothetical protein
MSDSPDCIINLKNKSILPLPMLLLFTIIKNQEIFYANVDLNDITDMET